MSATTVPYMLTDGGREGDEHNDCTVRAVAIAANVPYSRAHEALRTSGRKDRRGIRLVKVLQEVARALDVSAMHVKRSGTIAKLIKQYPHGRLVVTIRAHAFAVVEGTIHDAGVLSPICRVKHAWIIHSKTPANTDCPSVTRPSH